MDPQIFEEIQPHGDKVPDKRKGQQVIADTANSEKNKRALKVSIFKKNVLVLRKNIFYFQND